MRPVASQKMAYPTQTSKKEAANQIIRSFFSVDDASKRRFYALIELSNF